jgi:hypothetical protein
MVAAEKATVLIYVDASKEVGDVDHLKVFANDDAAGKEDPTRKRVIKDRSPDAMD